MQPKSQVLALKCCHFEAFILLNTECHLLETWVFYLQESTLRHALHVYIIRKQCASFISLRWYDHRNHGSLHSQPICRDIVDLVWIYSLLYFNSIDMNASIHMSPPLLWEKKRHAPEKSAAVDWKQIRDPKPTQDSLKNRASSRKNDTREIKTAASIWNTVDECVVDIPCWLHRKIWSFHKSWHKFLPPLLPSPLLSLFF